MGNRPEKKPTGRVNYVWVLAGGYLVYLAAKLIAGQIKGDASSPLVSLGGATLFLAVGGGVLLREWRAYRYGLEHIDDPDSWSDEEQEDGEEEGGA